MNVVTDTHEKNLRLLLNSVNFDFFVHNLQTYCGDDSYDDIDSSEFLLSFFNANRRILKNILFDCCHTDHKKYKNIYFQFFIVM